MTYIISAEHEARLKKSPRWMRELVAKMQSDVGYYKRKAEQRDGTEPTSVYVETVEGLKPMPDGSYLFALETVRERPRGVRVWVHDGEVKLMSDIGRLALFPSAANCAEVRLVDR